uniref:RRM domain-containing protein n=1 Tax=Oryzias melastigma TaxID=30732 RepID=A0A3B3CXD4_ORYME
SSHLQRAAQSGQNMENETLPSTFRAERFMSSQLLVRRAVAVLDSDSACSFLVLVPVQVRWSRLLQEGGYESYVHDAHTLVRKKIFVGGLKNDIFEFQLTQYFSQFGQVEKSEIMVDLETRKYRGFGFVHFTDASAADKAALVKFHTVNGHQVEVKKALTKQEIQGENKTSPGVMGENQNGLDYPGNNTNGGYGVKRAVEKTQCTNPEPVANAMGKKIFVGGLKNDIFEFHLTQYFSQYGQVEKSEIIKDMVTGRNRGFGFVHFTDPSAADNAALEMFHTVIGHKVEVKKTDKTFKNC